jgi:hypothetical protein
MGSSLVFRLPSMPVSLAGWERWEWEWEWEFGEFES